MTETCNGADDNCDGAVDESCQCKSGDSQPCGTDVGECVAGSEKCANGMWGACSGNIDGLVETPLAQHQGLVGAEHQPPGYDARDRARLRARQQCRHLASRARSSGLLDRALIDIGRTHFDRDAGSFQQRTPRRAL